MWWMNGVSVTADWGRSYRQWMMYNGRLTEHNIIYGRWMECRNAVAEECLSGALCRAAIVFPFSEDFGVILLLLLRSQLYLWGSPFWVRFLRM